MRMIHITISSQRRKVGTSLFLADDSADQKQCCRARCFVSRRLTTDETNFAAMSPSAMPLHLLGLDRSPFFGSAVSLIRAHHSCSSGLNCCSYQNLFTTDMKNTVLSNLRLVVI